MSPLTRRSFLSTAGLLGLGMVLQACGGSPGTGSAAPSASTPARLEALKIGWIAATIVHEPMHLAKQKGFFAKQGLDVTLQDAAGSAQIAALGAGELQFATIGSSELVNANAGGSPIAMIASLADVPMLSLYVIKGVKTVQDLAGKSIGVGRVGAATDLGAQLFLKHEGLANSVKIVAVGGESPAVLAALSKGLVAGGVFSPPSTAEAAKAGYVELINGAKLGIYWTSAGLMATRGYLKDHGDVARRVARALQETWSYLADPANKDDVIADISAATAASSESAVASYDYMLPAWTAVKTPMVDPRGIASAIDLSPQASAKGLKPDSMIDNSFLQAAASS